MVLPPQPPDADLLAQYLGLLEALTAISSPTGDRVGLDRCCELLGEILQTEGLSIETTEEADGQGRPMPVLHATSPSCRSADYLLLVGHLDTVQPAVPPRRDSQRLWATGAIDMKGGLIAFAAALALLQKSGLAPPTNLRLLVLPDEEIAGPICHRLMESFTSQARALWILEPGKREPVGVGAAAKPEVAETIVLGRRGLCHWHLQATGRPAHAGNDFWTGRSALAAAGEWSAAAAALSRPDGGPLVNPARLVAGEASFVESLDRHSELLGSARQSNVVPDRARVDGEARFSRREDGEQLLSDLERLTAETGQRREVELEFTPTPLISPLEPTAASRRLADRAIGLARNRGRSLQVEEDRGGISFANFLANPGAVPTLDGLGPTGGGMHTRREFMWLDSFAFRVELLADLLASEATS